MRDGSHLEMRLMTKRKAPSGRMDNRNQGNTMLTTPMQNSTMDRFWSTISACMVSRTSTEGRQTKADTHG